MQIEQWPLLLLIIWIINMIIIIFIMIIIMIMLIMIIKCRNNIDAFLIVGYRLGARPPGRSVKKL